MRSSRMFFLFSFLAVVYSLITHDMAMFVFALIFAILGIFVEKN